MNIGNILRVLPEPAVQAAVWVINNIGPLRRWVSRTTINNYAYAAPSRPRAISMAASYTTWQGLTDKKFSGRHLPAASGDDVPEYPVLDQVVALFERKTMRYANDTSLLFPFFAQWFVDSFLRTKWEQGEERGFRENESNHEIDLCQIYGTSEIQTRMLREMKGGRLQSRIINGEEWPVALYVRQGGEWQVAPRYQRIPERDADHPAVPGLYTAANFMRVFQSWTDEEKEWAFAVGLEHGNSTIGNAAMNTLFLREHNRTAHILQRSHPDWDDERIFQTARNVTTAVLLNIVISDYIVHIAPVDFRLEAVPGMAERESWYRNNWMAVEFALLYRWHDLIPDEFTLGGRRLPATNMLKANKLIVETGLDQLLRDASQQRAGRIGLGNTADFLKDVKQLSLVMGRSCQLPGYNAYRRYYGLKPIDSFEVLTGEAELAARLSALYGSVDRLEWFVGIFAENYSNRQMMGELLVTMVANDAFTQALTNPLLAETVHNENTFGPEGMEIVRSTNQLAQVVVRNTGIDDPGEIGFKVRSEA